MARDVVVVQPVVGDQLMHQRQRQRAIGAGQQLQMFVALVGGFGLARVDADQARTVALGLLCKAPEVQVAADAVAAPDEDQPAFGKKFHAHAELATVGVEQRLAASGRADGAVQQRGTQLVKEAAVHALALHHAHGACVAVGQHRLGVAPRDGVQARRDVCQRFVPRHGDELAASLGAHALERREHTLGVIGALGVFADFGTQHAAGEAVIGVSAHFGGDAVDHGGDQGAGIRAVVGAGAFDGACGMAMGVHVSVGHKNRR
ncbi:hypothetical protein SDC9_72605 [bioreactor metagenome]|uniref:Uncharacterized protein n=1 Tax=bioreactor metagenome TaxID=1076179 RepID=A0A644YJ11_9ZZZZ